MKLSTVAILGLGLLAAPAAFADPDAGSDIFAARCNMCHGSGMGGAPLTEKLAALTPEVIVEKMTTGTMAAMSAGISDDDKKAIAAFLTTKKPA